MHPLAKQIYAVLDDVIPSNMSYALLDFPNHSNVGDSAIWLGEVDYLRKGNANIRYTCHYAYYDPGMLKIYHPRGSILIHGGGNIGDIWQHHQRLRESILKGFSDCKIIQFPQTIYFQSCENLETCKQIIRSHKDFVLVVRDRSSFDFAQKHFSCEIKLCPDMAFAMRPGRLKKMATDPSVKAVYLSRTDKESTEKAKEGYPSGLLVIDWVIERPPELLKLYKITSRLEARQILRLWFPIQAMRFRVMNSMAQERLDRGCRLISRSKRLVTDRLHGVILGAMLGRRIYAFDNSYGKLSSFVETWGNYLPEVTFYESERAAIDAALS